MKSFLSLLLLCLTSMTVMAQSDVSKYYLSNYGFDSNFDYEYGDNTSVAQEIKNIDGWTADISVDYTISGVYQYGFSGTFNNATVPAYGYNGSTGGALALSTGWDQKFCYYQIVTLPAGTYTINVPTYNGYTATGGKSQLSWIPNNGTTVTSSLSSYPSKEWTLDKITFTLSAKTTGKIQIGYTAASEGSANSANLLIDYVQIMGSNMAVDKTELRTTLQSANSAYSSSSTGAADLLAAINSAQTVYNNSSATMPQVLEANDNLKQALETYRQQNASDTNPVDYTSYIVNPSFESDVATGWTNNGMWRQTNSVFTGKVGTYYLESWVSTANSLGNCGVSQTLNNLPAGNYRLKVNAQHINENSPATPQTGVYLFAGSDRQTVTTNNTYSLSFAVIEDAASITIGLLGENATGNYLCLDNFILEYLGTINTDSYKSEIRNLIAIGQELLSAGLQTSVQTTLNSAISAGNSALNSSNLNTLQTAYNNLISAIEAAQESRNLYAKLQARIDYAEKVLGWWQGEAYRATNWNSLQTAVNTAKTQVTNYNLTTAQINSAISSLNTSISKVDKSIYCSGNACGSDADLQNNDSYWSYERSYQSKHWILFWEKGYGNTVPAAVPGIMENADQLFEFYANDLGFITINQGSSKTDTYKMIIRLKYSTNWEASGSGIDNVIGLLTLSNGAHTSRSGQTVAHEIGHCFQYQTHCDNNNWNGWMYNWGNSTLNVFWEMCAQWQAYKFYPTMQFVWDSNQGNDWFGGTINGLHRHPLCVDLRYNNYFIQDYFCHKQGNMKFIGRMWNESYSPEDPLQTYMRLTMTGTTAQKLAKLGDEMWEYGARMTTFDLDPIRTAGAWRIGFRNQTALTKDSENYWWPTQANCIENFGNNAIRINAPSRAKTIYVEFEGKAGADGYNNYNTQYAGWRIGFVAYKNDGTRVYGDINSATAGSPNKTIAFDCPAGCSYVWLVVSGAPTNYWTRDWLSWSEESDVEQWPYRVKFHQTNVYGQTDNNTYPENVDDDPYHTALELCRQAAENKENGVGAANAALADFEWTDDELANKTTDEINKAIEVLNNGATIASDNQVATSLVGNADFTGAYTNGSVQGSGGRVQIPNDWTFTYTYQGWNDTYVDATNKLFNAWAGSISRAELSQTINNLPNGTYRLSADVRVDTEAPNSSTAIYGYGDWTIVARSQEAGSEISGSTTAFANYSCAFEVNNNVATIGIRSDYSFYQIKNIKLEFINGLPAQTETDASYLRQDYFWNNRTADEVDLTTTDAVSKYGNATGVKLYPLFPNQIIYAASASQFVEEQNNVVANGTCANLVITDGQHITITKPFNATYAKYTRTMAATTKWGTLCLPYPLTSDDNVQYYLMTDVNESWMTYQPAQTVLPNTPVVFAKLKDNAASLTFTGSGSVATTTSQQNKEASNVEGWTLEGLYAEKTLEESEIDGTVYYVAQNKFWKANTTNGLRVPAFRAYFHGPASLSVKSFGLCIDDNATDIMPVGEDFIDNRQWYTIDGRQLHSRPAQPGIYIVGGKKVLIK